MVSGQGGLNGRGGVGSRRLWRNPSCSENGVGVTGGEEIGGGLIEVNQFLLGSVAGVAAGLQRADAGSVLRPGEILVSIKDRE